MAVPEKRLAAFSIFAREGIRWHLVAGMPKADVVDGLRDIAVEAGLDEGAVQNALVAAVEHPFVPMAPRPVDRASEALKPDWRSKCITAATLQSQDFPAVSHIVPGVLPEGLTLLAGKPKIGKSWLALDICLAIAGNRMCLGDRSPETGDVLYVALEDNLRRLQRRIGKLISEATWPARLTLATEWRRLDKGGVEDVSEWADGAKSPRLAVLDTLAGIRPIRSTPGYSEDYEALAPVHRLANERGFAVLVLHHMRKMGADDPVDTVSGTLGLTGCADTILVLARGSTGTTLYCRGRDVEEAEHAVRFDAETCRWTMLGEAAQVHRSEERRRVMAALAEGEMAIVDLASATGMKRANLERLLHSMVKDGEVARVDKGVYGLVDVDGR